MKVKGSKQRVTVHAYPVVRQAVEDGVAYGITRVFKYLEVGAALTEDGLRERADELASAVIDAICEVVDFGDGP